MAIATVNAGKRKCPGDASRHGANFGKSKLEFRRQVHVFGDASPALQAWCEANGIPLHVFGWQAPYELAGLARDAAHLLRPDTNVALAAPMDAVSGFESHLKDRGDRHRKAAMTQSWHHF